MDVSRFNKIQDHMLGTHYEWSKKFDVNEYMNNAPMIEKLYEEKQILLAKSIDLDNDCSQLRYELQNKEKELINLNKNFNSFSRNSKFSFCISLLGIILIGIGINMATNDPTDLIGWFMMISGCTAELIAFLIGPGSRV